MFWTMPKSHVKDQMPHITEDGRYVTIQYYLDLNITGKLVVPLGRYP